MIPTRLGKFLRERTGISYGALGALYEASRIRLAFESSEGLREYIFEGDEVWVDGKVFTGSSELLYAVLHKPVGVVSTVRSPDGTPDLAPYISALGRGVFPVGRLDRDSSGLLLLCNDGDLAYALLSPTHHVEKQYLVVAQSNHEFAARGLHSLLGSMVIDGVKMCTKSVNMLEQAGRSCTLSIVLEEGKHHQIRRMCRQVGLSVRSLSRVRIGPISLNDLQPGQLRRLSPDETAALWRAVGGHEEILRRQLTALARSCASRQALGKPHVRLEAWLRKHATT